MGKGQTVLYDGEIKVALDTTVSTTEYDTVENGTMLNLTSEAQLNVVSTSANDTSAGTGAQKVLLTYLDDDFNLFTEMITLNGTTPVNTVATNIRHIERFEVCCVGSNEFNVGDISLKNLAGTETYAFIEIGKNESFSCVHHAPVGKRCYITGLQMCSLSSGAINIQLRYEKDFTMGGKVTKIFDKEVISNYGSIMRHYSVALRVEAGNHIRLVAKGTTEGQQISARMCYFEVSI